MSTDEKRGVERIVVSRPVLVRAEGQRFQAKLANISGDGAGIFSEASLNVGTIVVLNFELLVFKRMISFVVKGIVMHSHFRANAYYLGVRFGDLPAESAKDLAEFVQYKQSLKKK